MSSYHMHDFVKLFPKINISYIYYIYHLFHFSKGMKYMLKFLFGQNAHDLYCVTIMNVTLL